MSLSRFFSVSLQNGAVSPAQQGFGTALLVANGTQFRSSEVRSYQSYAALAADFASNQFVLNAGQAFFSQNPRPQELLVSLLPAPNVSQTYRCDITTCVSGTTPVLTVTNPSGVATTVSGTWTTNHSTTAGLLSTQINTIAGLTSSNASGVITITASTPATFYEIDSATPDISLMETTADLAYDTHLTSVRNRRDFYAFCVDRPSPINIDKCARWAQTNERMFIASPQATKADQYTSARFTSPSHLTDLLANDRCSHYPTKRSRKTPLDVAVMSKMLPAEPGTNTWAYKSIDGFGGDAWTDTELTHLMATLGGNYYQQVAGVNITFPGKQTSGEWTDVVIAEDYLRARIRESMGQLMFSTPKVPYTAKGANMVASAVSSVLQEAERRGMIDSGWAVTILPVDQQAQADRTGRILRFVEFQCRLAGAIHTSSILGVVQQ
jgi:hypothetical protein